MRVAYSSVSALLIGMFVVACGDDGGGAGGSGGSGGSGGNEAGGPAEGGAGANPSDGGGGEGPGTDCDAPVAAIVARFEACGIETEPGEPIECTPEDAMLLACYQPCIEQASCEAINGEGRDTEAYVQCLTDCSPSCEETYAAGYEQFLALLNDACGCAAGSPCEAECVEEPACETNGSSISVPACAACIANERGAGGPCLDATIQSQACTGDCADYVVCAYGGGELN